MKIKLTKRLAAAAQAVREGKRVADIGCDHGKLCAFLIASGKCPSAVASDKNEKPLARAAAIFKALGIEDKIKLVLCDGLSEIAPGEADDIVIAGVGFEVISGIISGAEWLKSPDKRLVLVPASHHAHLRRWLYRKGFEIVGEAAVFEAGHCYSVMTVLFSGQLEDIGAVFAVAGKINADSADGKKYLENEYHKAKKIMLGSDDEQKRRDAQAVMRYLEKGVEKCD